MADEGERYDAFIPAEEPADYNLLGQRLGRKGRDTRERILAATERLLQAPDGIPISLSAVARHASLAMTTLYLYFNDLTELLLAVLNGIMASSEKAYVAQLRVRWPDETLGEECERFIQAYYAFWERHSRILHLRNSYADLNDHRMYQHRRVAAEPVHSLLTWQMNAPVDNVLSPAHGLASVLLTGIERMAAVMAHLEFAKQMPDDPAPNRRNLLRAEARLLELGIRDGRAASARAGA